VPNLTSEPSEGECDRGALKANHRIDPRQDSGDEGNEGGKRSDQPRHRDFLDGTSSLILGIYACNL
jgi:hypothetical protein